MDGQSLISQDVLARYAADAAREVDGVAGLAESTLHRGKGVVFSGDETSPTVEIRLELEWGRNAPGVAGAVQQRVAEYLERMANVKPASVDVVVHGVGSPPAKRR
jgi:uncharacterized alkaline shock family protein YloU